MAQKIYSSSIGVPIPKILPCNKFAEKFADLCSSWKDDNFFPMKSVRTWIDKPDNANMVQDFFKDCVEHLEQNWEWKPVTVKSLPQPVEPDLRSMSSCHIIHSSDPWNFHIIFLDNFSQFEFNLKNVYWTNFFRKWRKSWGHSGSEKKVLKYCFQSSSQLLCGMTFLLSKFFLHIVNHYTTKRYNPDKIAGTIVLSPGDLVVVAIPRVKIHAERKPDKEECVLFGYRAVVLKSEVVREYKKDKFVEETKFRVYLLDTGEQFLLARPFLRPLPSAFTRFTPMAVHCALHGISPIGPDWSQAAKLKMKEILSSLNLSSQTVIAQFYSKKPSEANRSTIYTYDPEIQKILSELVDRPPYFVEITMSPSQLNRGQAATNLSDLLLEERLALEWCLVPQRSFLCKPTAISGEDPNHEESIPAPFASIPRSQALHLSEGQPVPLKPLGGKELRSEFVRLFKHIEHLQEEVIPDEGHDNILSLKIFDPDGTKRSPSVPQIFQPCVNGSKD